MQRIRAVGIIIKDNQILLIHRFKDGKEYYTFPGGGVEDSEQVEEAVIREIKKETTLEIKITKLLYSHVYDNDTAQYFYLCEYVSGEAKLDINSPEFKSLPGSGQIFEPVWTNIDKINNLTLYPLEIRDLLIDDIKNNFINPVKVSIIKYSERRQ